MSSKVIVITGASGGIGAALARELGTKGHRLVLAARREIELQQIAKEVATVALPVITDVTVRSEVERLRDAALQKFGQIDVWINNAGRGIGRRILDLTDEDFDEMMSINVKSALYGMQSVVPYFQLHSKGHLINVSSFLGRVPYVSFRSAYNAAKHALNALTANLRMDLRSEYPNIHVSLVMPGMVLTDFQKNALHGTPAFTPSNRVPQGQSAEDVAVTIANLIENPQAEIYTNPAQAETVFRYYQNVDAFEEAMIKS